MDTQQCNLCVCVSHTLACVSHTLACRLEYIIYAFIFAYHSFQQFYFNLYLEEWLKVLKLSSLNYRRYGGDLIARPAERVHGAQGKL